MNHLITDDQLDELGEAMQDLNPPAYLTTALYVCWILLAIIGLYALGGFNG